MSETTRITLERVHELAQAACNAAGCSGEQARAVADTVTAAERDGCPAHGLLRIPFFVRALRDSGVYGDAVPTVDRLAPSIVRVDGGLGFAPLALEMGCSVLVETAREQGIAALAVNNVFHISALWPEAERLAEADLVGFAFTTAIDYVAPAGGDRPLFGTNPMAFAWPRNGKPPVVFDQASSAAARGEILLHQRASRALPEGWAVGPDAQPTTDPDRALAGAQLPFGGYKGASIALMIELLAGALIGDLLSYEAGEYDSAGVGAPRGGEFLIAIDPSRCSPDGDRSAPLAHAERLFERILTQDGTRLPGQRRFEVRELTRSAGVDIDNELLDQIRGVIGGTP